jgi:hypothetical protein
MFMDTHLPPLVSAVRTRKREENSEQRSSLFLDSGRIRLCEAPCGADVAFLRFRKMKMINGSKLRPFSRDRGFSGQMAFLKGHKTAEQVFFRGIRIG